LTPKVRFTFKARNSITRKTSWAEILSSSIRTPTKPAAAESRSPPNARTHRANSYAGMARRHACFVQNGQRTMDHSHTHTTGRRELQMARSMCWHCQSEVSGEYFCERCVKVQ